MSKSAAINNEYDNNTINKQHNLPDATYKKNKNSYCSITSFANYTK